jgi:pantothenate kinase
VPVVEQVDVVAAGDVAGWIRPRSARTRRYLFGIAGPPGSGKSTLAARVGADLGAPVVPMDGFHRRNADLAERGQLAIKGAPETFDALAFIALVRELRRPNTAADCPAFDRTIDEPVAGGARVTADDVVVIVEGNYLLLDEPPWGELAELFDAVAYLDIPDEVRIERLVERHVAFGRARRDAIDFVDQSDEANTRRIAPGRRRADLLVSFPPAGSS